MLPPEAPGAAGAAADADAPLELIARLATLAALATAVAVAAGCGDDDEVGSEPAAATELEITLDADGQGGRPPESAQLRCGGEAEERACALLDELPADPAAPVPPDTACTEIYGGPATVTLSGTLNGESIDAKLTRENGCEIERFDRWMPLLQELFPDYKPGSSIAAK